MIVVLIHFLSICCRCLHIDAGFVAAAAAATLALFVVVAIAVDIDSSNSIHAISFIPFSVMNLNKTYA